MLEKRNYVDLIALKAANILEKQEVEMILNDDVWDNNILLVKSGGYLTENLLNKLIQFGVKQVSVDINEADSEQEQGIDYLREFIATQNVLIVEDNLHQTLNLIKNLKELGFEKPNISVTANYNAINRFFRLKKINLIFINSYFYEKCAKCIDKYGLLRDTHAFVILEQNESARKLKISSNSQVKFLNKPLTKDLLKFFINQAMEHNLADYDLLSKSSY